MTRVSYTAHKVWWRRTSILPSTPGTRSAASALLLLLLLSVPGIGVPGRVCGGGNRARVVPRLRREPSAAKRCHCGAAKPNTHHHKSAAKKQGPRWGCVERTGVGRGRSGEGAVVDRRILVGPEGGAKTGNELTVVVVLARPGELDHGLLQVVERTLHEASVLLEVDQQVVPQRLPGQHLRDERCERLKRSYVGKV